MYFGVVLVAGLLLAACAGAPVGPSGGLNVVATTGIVADVVAQVGGEHIHVTVLIPAGADPHAFEPAPQDAAALAGADLVFANGFGLEETLQALLDAQGNKVVYVSDGVEPLAADDHHHHGEEHHDDHDHEGEDHHDDHEHEGEDHHDDHEHEGGEDHHDDHDGPDPHAWMNPQNVKVWVANITAALSAADPANAADYQANAAAYEAELDALDHWAAEELGPIPADQRILVSDHGTLAYFAQRYGFEVVGALVPGVSTLSEPSAGELAALESLIREHGLRAIFVGETANPALAQRVAADTGIELVLLYTEALSEPGGPAANYLEMMRYNVNAIVEALQ
ncbi:MAG: zinc ABC transporter substrate-binding protein [Anaerolineales bacterium]|nr:zinc ABC transporter substrate-binding protein [Anaerolineales bacterium]